jgi:DNA modification methylase
LIAAERVKRVCRGIEVDPRAVDTTVRRWQTDTGKAARHVGSGLSFDEIQQNFGYEQ